MRVAVVGAGGMGGTHARAYAQIPSANLVGIADIRLEAAKSLGDAVGAEAFASLEELAAKVQPDVIDICVPTPIHREMVETACALHPRGIVVEKPMARTVADACAIRDHCASAGVPLFVAHVLRFFPEFVTARQQVGAGAVGKPVCIRTRRGGPFPRAWENWYSKLAWSGGAILDLVIHDLDWLRWTFGEVERVYAKSLAAGIPPDGSVEQDYSLITLRFESGAMAHVEATWADPGGFKVTFEIAGDKGLLEYNFNQPAGAPLVVSKAGAGSGSPGVPVPESPISVSPYQQELEHFLHCLSAGDTPRVSPQDGIEAVRLGCAAIESSRTGQPVRVKGFGEEAR